MTLLPVPKQTSLFMTAWPSSLLSYTLLPFTFLSPLLTTPAPPPLFGLSRLPHVHNSRSVMQECMAGACSGSDQGVGVGGCCCKGTSETA